MSNDFNWDDHKEVGASKDFSWDDHKEVGISHQEPKADDSSLQTAKDALTGAGDTLGISQQIGGAAEAIPNSIQSVLHKFAPSLVGASPTQVAAGLKALGFKGDLGATSTPEMYKEGTKDTLKQQDEALERSPIAYRGGEATGLGLGAAATAGLMPEIAGAGAVSKASPYVGNTLAKMGAAAINSAPVGALYGGLNSKGSVIGGIPQEQQEVKGDVKTGAELGGALGAAGSGVSQSLGKLGDIPALQKLKGLFDLGEQGTDVTSKESQVGSLSNPLSFAKAMSTHDTNAANTMLTEMNQVDSSLGSDVGKALNNATEKGVTIEATPDISAKIDDLLNNTQDAGSMFKNVTALANKYKTEGLDPNEMWQLRNNLGEISKQLGQSGSAQDRLMAPDVYNLSKALSNTLKQSVPDYGLAAERMQNFRRLMPETVLSKDNPVDVTDLHMGGIKKVDTKLINGIKQMIGGLNTGDAKAQGSFTNLLQNLQELNTRELELKSQGKIQQTIFDQLGQQPQDIEKFITDKAKTSALIQPYLKGDKAPPTDFITKGMSLAQNSAGTVANKAGKVTQGFTSFADQNPVLTSGKKLYAATDDTLRNFSNNVLSKIPGQESLSQALNKALDSKDQVAKNAVLFSIMQTPTLRSLVKSNDLDQ